MKKILMFGIAALALAGCSSDLDFDQQEITPDSKKANMYSDAFTGAFGQVNENVDWGFENQTLYSVDENGNMVTRGHNVNRNEWGTGNGNGGHVAVPVNVTDNERQLVFDYFNKKREGAVNEYNVNWTDFYISEVWKGEDHYSDGFGNDVLGSDHMNHLQVRKGEGYIDEWGGLQGDWEHANDFNNGNHYADWNSIKGHTFMQSSGTLEFAYHNTTDSKYHNEYIIIPGALIDASLADYYYVGFDFYATHPIGQDANKNMDVERDWVFTDWIVRISPGEFINTKRIMAEDLIASSLNNVDKSDLDFNDVVFDVTVMNEWVASVNNNKLVAHVTLRAAGGTLPLYIGQLDEKYEVHKLFGVSTETMVNTNAKAQGKYKAVNKLAPVQFTMILGDADYSQSYNYANFPIYVGGEQLVAPLGKATHKLCVPTTTKWMKEKSLITTGYPKFTDYVNNGTPADWYTTTGTNLY